MNSKLAKKYFNPKDKAAFLGAKSFKRELWKSSNTINTKTIDDWLSGQDAYTLHKKIVNKFRRRSTIAPSAGVQIQADLLDVQSHANDNDGNKFLLTAIDIMSRKAWAIPIKNKSGVEVAGALGKILLDSSPRLLQTDKGKEFYNTHVGQLLDRFKVTHFSTENENIKASIVERFNRTLRKLLYRAFTKMGRYRYIDILEDIVNAYNNRYNSAIGMAPNELTPGNQEDVWLKLHDNEIHFLEPKPKFSINDPVRITKSRTAFQRGYTPNWSREVFYISKVLPTSPVTYKIRDYNNEMIAGSFYSQELQKIKEPELYDVEEVLDRKKIGGKKMVLVKWMGYPEIFNQWIPESDIVDK